MEVVDWITQANDIVAALTSWASRNVLHYNIVS